MKKRPQILYKYFIEERVEILENGLIRYTQPGLFNDPFEAFPYLKSITNTDIIDEYSNKIDDQDSGIKQRIFEIIENDSQFKSLPAHQKVLARRMVEANTDSVISKFAPMAKELFRSSMKLEGPAGKEMIKRFVNAVNSTIGILCLTDTYKNLLMWSHYANSHKGFVLGFNTDHKIFNKSDSNFGLFGYLKDVRYTKIRPETILFDTRKDKESNLDNWVKNFIWVKSSHWRYENEWRILEQLKMSFTQIKVNSELIHLYKIPFDAIHCIYLGCKMPNEQKNKISNIIKDNSSLKHITIIQAEMDNKEYKLNFKII